MKRTGQTLAIIAAGGLLALGCNDPRPRSDTPGYEPAYPGTVGHQEQREDWNKGVMEGSAFDDEIHINPDAREETESEPGRGGSGSEQVGSDPRLNDQFDQDRIDSPVDLNEVDRSGEIGSGTTGGQDTQDPQR